MAAMEVFAMCIRFLKGHLLNQLQKQVTGVEEKDIQYVITVPAIWDDSAKQFMREAAVQAGIETDRLKLALEPEVASIWCQVVTREAKGALSGSRTKYMVVDLGGGTADISVHEKNADGTLKELHKASGGPWGGIYVDNNYMSWLARIYGKEALETLKREEMVDYFDMFREFEVKKRTVTDSTDEITIRISAALKEMLEKKEKTTLQEKVNSLNLGESISIRRDKMKVDASIVRAWFNKPIDALLKHINCILNESSMKQVHTILLVGGFGESEYVHERMKNAFPTKTIIVPDEAGLVVLKGAVRFGHKSNIVSERVMKYTYGVACTKDFNESEHPASAMVVYQKKKKIDCYFDIFVKAGETIKYGHEVSKGYSPNDMNKTGLDIFCSRDSNPKFTTDPSCKKLGHLTLKHNEGTTLEEKDFRTIMTFGDTELNVKVRMNKTGKEFFTTIDCMDEN